MVWQASPGTYTVRIKTADSAAPPAIVTAGETGALSFTLEADAISPLKIRIDREKGS